MNLAIALQGISIVILGITIYRLLRMIVRLRNRIVTLEHLCGSLINAKLIEVKKKEKECIDDE